MMLAMSLFDRVEGFVYPRDPLYFMHDTKRLVELILNRIYHMNHVSAIELPVEEDLRLDKRVRCGMGGEVVDRLRLAGLLDVNLVCHHGFAS
jgi:hypothetical protein